MKICWMFAALACVVGLPCAWGEVMFADPFADGVVLQRGKPVPVWGTAKPASVVSVSFGGREVSGKADAAGRWRVDLPPMEACREGRILKAVEQSDRPGNQAIVNDVLVGDVWFVCGQSNTEFPLCGDNPHFSDRNGAAIASITRLPLVRFCYQSDYTCAVEPKTRAALQVKWQAFTPENLLNGHSFSAIGAYFAIYVHQATGVPLGLVGAYWGGTGIDSWTPREGTASRPDLKDILGWKSSLTWDGRNPKSIFRMNRICDQPAVLWNEMVAPWCPFAMKGLLWYQGCTNSREPERYCSKMHALYNGWSQKFENPDMKLYFVQLAPWGFTGIAAIQEAQADFEREQPNAGMAVINDLGNLTDIHPNEKGTVGLRLARMALKRDYGLKDIEDRSPALRSWRIEGDSFLLDFDHADRLYVYNRDFSAVTPFEIAGPDGVFKPAKIVNMICERRRNGASVWTEFRGRIDGAPRLVVKSDEVRQPVRLRYCHSSPWLGTVYNGANLPLAAFHIDGAVVGESVGFRQAKPVWPRALLLDKNVSLRFRAKFGSDGAPATLRIAGCSAFRIRLNGAFVGYGPARGPKGFHRVDEWPLKPRAGTNELEVVAASYNCESFYFPEQSPFLQAEILSGDRVLAATGTGDGFSAVRSDRIQKVARYSYQRCFAEAYRVGADVTNPPLALAVQPSVALLPRIAKYPSFDLNRSVRVISRAEAKANPDKKVKNLPYIQAQKPNPIRKQYLANELEADIWRDGLYVDHFNRRVSSEPWPAKLAAGESVLVDAGLNDCGFPLLTVEVAKPGKLLLTFDEVLTDGEVDASRLNCCNAVEWIFDRPGTYEVEAFEPYVWRYGCLFTLDGEMTVKDFAIRAYKNPETGRASFRSSDPALDKVFAAAKETFAQNAVDVFTDCPSRERAGWLCDSFFLGRVNRVLTGNADLEKLFLQNFALPVSFDDLPKGMIAMCYPGDQRNGNFIPNWAMWLVIETEEYLARSGDRVTVERLKPRFEALVDYLRTFRNADGLLEKLPKWVFVEWSRSNKLTQDVNYPSNMTFAEVLDVMDRLYGKSDMAAEAAKIRETIRRQSWTGKWFCDNAVRQADGSLKLSGECTETCQYYAFFFKTATPKTHPELWKALVDDFGPKRLADDKVTLKSHPEIWPSNAFIGNYLRLECLAREGLSKEILDETKGFFLYMAERTGTLWEMISTTASCNHGFASHAAITLYRDILGIREIDYAKKSVTVDVSADLDLSWCEGVLPVSEDESVKVRWEKGADGKPVLKTDLPPGWRLGPVDSAEDVRKTPEVRVRKTADGVGLFVDGERVEPWMFSCRDGTRSKAVKGDWTTYTLGAKSATDFERCQFHLRCVFPEKTGYVRYRNFSLTTNGVEVGGFSGAFASEAALRGTWAMWPPAEKTGWTNWVENGEWVQQVGPIGDRPVRRNYAPNSKHFPLKAGVEYRLTFEVRGDGVEWIQPNLYAVDGTGRCYTQILMDTDDFLCGQVKLAAKAGVNLVSFLWPSSWIDEGVYDFAELDALCDRILAANPHALLVPRFGVDAPKGWIDRHPDARLVFDAPNGPKDYYASPSSRAYRQAACGYVRAVARHMQEKYPRSFAGLHICGQETHEWFYHQANVRMNGYDPSTAADFGVPLPTAVERAAHEPDGILLSGPTAPKVYRFNKLLNAEMADLLVDLAKAARTATDGKKLVILFYGYTFELASSPNGPGNVGHYALQRLLDRADGAIDMIAAPIPYGDRGWKGISSEMGSVNTILRAGVMPMDENDTRTHLDKVTPRRLGAPQETYDVLERELAQGIFRNVGCWFFDLNGRDWFGDAGMWAKMSEARPLAQRVYAEGKSVAPDCALINDENSLMWVSAKVPGIHFGWPFVTEVRLMPAKAGLSSGHYLLSDVARKPVSSKLQLFLSAFAPTDADLAAIAVQRKTQPATRVWCWAPGLVDESGKQNLARMKKLTGFMFKRASAAVEAKQRYAPLFTVEEEPGMEVWSRWSDGTPRIAVKTDGGGHAVFMGLYDYQPAMLRRLAKLAGAKLLLADEDVGRFNAWGRGDHVLRQSVETGKCEL